MGKSEPYIILDWLRILMKALTHQTETEQTHSTRKKKKNKTIGISVAQTGNIDSV